MMIKTFFSTILAFFIGFFSPIQVILYVTLFSTLIDFSVGLYKSMMIDKSKWKKEKAFKTVARLVGFFIAISVSRVMELYVTPGIPLTQAVTTIINIILYRSLLINLGVITDTDLWNNVKQLFHKKKD